MVSKSTSAVYRKPRPGRGGVAWSIGLERDHLIGLRTFFTRNLGELYLLAVNQGAMTLANDGAEVNEQVFSTATLDKTITLVIVEPLNGSGLSFRHLFNTSKIYYKKCPSLKNGRSPQILENTMKLDSGASLEETANIKTK
jgi:hypothetical protein